jgi:hypothetical protein
MGQSDIESCHTRQARPASPVGTRTWTPGGIPRGRPASAFWQTAAVMLLPGEPLSPAETICSARGCRRPAAWGLLWNNPKLHPPERRKAWTACDQHRPDLESFLRSRGLLRETVPVEDLR